MQSRGENSAPTAADRTQNTLILASLTEESKQAVWRYLATRRKDFAARLQQASENSIVKTLLDQHDASLVISFDILPKRLRNSLAYAH